MDDLSQPFERSPPPVLDSFYTPEYLERRRRALEQMPGPEGMDDLDPKGPSGHAYAIRTSTWLTSNYRQTHRKGAMDVTPQEVIDVLNAAGVKSWVLMGLHGYVGYMPDPRATKDVDVMVSHRDRKRAHKAIAQQWPQLQVRELSQVIRFLDPGNPDADGNPKPVIDIMLPWSPFQEQILKEHVVIDEATQHRLPTIEAALVSKFGAMISLHRDYEKKHQDAVDFRRIAKANYDRIDHDALQKLAAMVWDGGAEEIERFLGNVMNDEPFPI